MTLSRNVEAQGLSERAIASMLTAELGLRVHRSTVRRLKGKGVNINDPAEVRHALAMQKRQPGPIGSRTIEAQTKPSAPIDGQTLTTSQIDAKLADLQGQLLSAPDYEVARKIRTQIAGIRELIFVQVDRGKLIDREDVHREANMVGQTVKALVLKIPSELPQQLVGLDYPAAVAKCEDYAYGILTTLAETQNPHP